MENTNQPTIHETDHPAVGLCLSGGGARGLAHIGVLRVLEREGIPIDLLSGTSMGGVIAAGFAGGLGAYEIEAIALEATHKKQLLSLSDLGVPKGGLIRGQQVYTFFTQIFGEKTFADLYLPLSVVAVDLYSHKEIILDQGEVAFALRATTAIPGIFMPVESKQYRFVDGGVLNNLPVDVLKKMGAEKVIAVDIGLNREGGLGQWIAHKSWIPKAVTSTLEVLDDTVHTLRLVEQENKMRQFSPDILIQPEIPGDVSSMFGYDRVSELIEIGDRATERLLPEIEAILMLAN
jgi:NTE family protein